MIHFSIIADNSQNQSEARQRKRGVLDKHRAFILSYFPTLIKFFYKIRQKRKAILAFLVLSIHLLTASCVFNEAAVPASTDAGSSRVNIELLSTIAPNETFTPPDSTPSPSEADLEESLEGIDGGKIEIELIEPIVEPFVFAWITDTQWYSESNPEIFTSMTNWVNENIDELNIKYLFHTGDIVQDKSRISEWKNASRAMSILDDSLPYGVLAGNHDIGTKKKDYAVFSNYFGAERFKNKEHFGGSYKDNRGHYDLLKVGDQEFLMVYIGWGVDNSSIEWMNEVLSQHPDKIAFIAAHDYLSTSGRRSDNGKKLFKNVVQKNQNVRFVLCGHNYSSKSLTDVIDDDDDGTADRIVYQLMANFQDEDNGGNGYLRLLKFDPAKNIIHVQTYSPYKEKYDKSLENDFTLEYQSAIFEPKS